MQIKLFCLAACMVATLHVSAQADILVKGDTLLLPNGSKFWRGEQVTLNQGSLPDKSFNFVYMPELLHIVKKKPLPASYSGQTATISKFQRDGAYKGGYSYNIIVLDFGPLKSYWCDVQNALMSNELVKPSSPAALEANDRQAQLARLKKLFDSGQISKDEYETLKNKLESDKAAAAPSSKPAPVKKGTKHTHIVF